MKTGADRRRRAGSRARGAAGRARPPRDARADERVGVVEPGDARPRSSSSESSAARLEARRRAPPSSRRTRRPCAPSAPRGRSSARAGSSPRARRARSVGLKPTIAAAGGGDPDRAARVGAERRVGEPGRERGRRAAARAAGDPARERRVRDRPVVRVHGRDPVRELVQVRLADVRVAGGLEPRHGLGGLARARGRRRRSSRTSWSARPCRTGP